jgi:hypothetical protein
MLSFKQYLKARFSPCATKNPQKILQEGIELSASDLIDQLSAMKAKSIFAKVIAENDDEVTLHLQVKKWGVAN